MISEMILCKECLGKPEVVKWSVGGIIKYSVECKGCDNSTARFLTKKEALAEWKGLVCENEYDDEMRRLSDEDWAEYREILDKTFKSIFEVL